jgi:hypothetical protein
MARRRPVANALVVVPVLFAVWWGGDRVLASSAPAPGSEPGASEAFAESILAREEAESARPFDPAFRAQAKRALAAFPQAALAAQAGDGGLGLSSLGDSQADLVYTPVAPCRIIDTRIAGGAIASGTTRSFLVSGTDLSAQGGNAAGCNVPFGSATAAVINLVAVSPAGPGNLRITPFGTPMPQASIINYAAVPGLAIANGPAVTMCNPSAVTCTQDVTIRADASATHLVADVQGYFRRVSAGGVGTQLLADQAVTAPKIASGAVVRSLNAQTDTVTLSGSNGLSVTQGSGTVTVSSDATASNVAGAIVARDGSGGFAAGTIAAGSLFLTGNLDLPATSSAAEGVLTQAGAPFLHGFGKANTFVGKGAGNLTLEGGNNSGVGFQALTLNATGAQNSAFGAGALQNNVDGQNNSAFGASALTGAYSGQSHSAFGAQALANVSVGGSNSAFGADALAALVSGSMNIAIGRWAGSLLSSGDNNIYVGNVGGSTESGVIRIGSNQTATWVAGVWGGTSASGVAVYVSSSGRLGTVTSSRRYKEEIEDMEAGSDVLLKLRPVSFYYRPELDGDHVRQYGLVAEEVAEVAPELVVRDEEGQPQTVRYHFVNAMLLNEVQKQRRRIEAQEAEIRELRAGLAQLRELKAELASLEARLAQE